MQRTMQNNQVNGLVCAVLLLILLFVSESYGATQIRTFTNNAGLFDPSAGPLTIKYQLMEDAETIEIRIIDFRGQVANRFTAVELRAGDQRFSWDGTDNNGKRVVDGRYQIVITAKFATGSSQK